MFSQGASVFLVSPLDWRRDIISGGGTLVRGERRTSPKEEKTFISEIERKISPNDSVLQREKYKKNKGHQRTGGKIFTAMVQGG